MNALSIIEVNINNSSNFFGKASVLDNNARIKIKQLLSFFSGEDRAIFKLIMAASEPFANNQPRFCFKKAKQ